MTFDCVLTKDGRHCFVDGYPVREVVYDTLFPSKLFPIDTGMTLEEAETELLSVKAATKPPEDNGFIHHQPAIRGDKPLRSDALAVHTKQIPAVLARNAKHGINIKYDRVGRPVFTSAGERKALMKLEKVRSMNSFDGY